MLEHPTTRATQEQSQLAVQHELGRLEASYGFNLISVIPFAVFIVIFLTIIFFFNGILVGMIGISILLTISFIVVVVVLRLRDHLKSIFLYEHGLVQKTSKGTNVIRWDSAQNIKKRQKIYYMQNGGTSTNTIYTIQGIDNIEIIFTQSIEHYSDLFSKIGQRAIPYLLSQARKRYHEGQEVLFDPLVISSTGIHNRNKGYTLPWSKVACVDFLQPGDIKIKQKGKLFSWFTGEIPNAEVLQIMAEEILEGREKKGRILLPAELVPGRPQLAQRYEIIKQVGQGGYGIVYKAYDRERKNMLVAIKQIDLNVLSPREMIEATDSYNREVQHLSKLEHKNLPRIYDHFTDPQHWYVVMEYIEGETLEDYLATIPLSVATVIGIGITLCSVLGYLHSQNPPIIFRDVKPSNIMRTPAGHLYLIDFGIARRYTPGKRRDTGPLGSPGYAAPEQYGKAQTTVQTDIYGLGVTLQTLLTRKEPLEMAEDEVDQLLPMQLQPLLKQMLEPDSSKRPQSMDEVKKQLLQLKKKFFHNRGRNITL